MSLHPLRTLPLLPRAFSAALQWRLLLLWTGTSLACALIAALPLWAWLGLQLDHSPQAADIATGRAPALLLDLLTAPEMPMALFNVNLRIAGALMLLLSPVLTGATVAALRSREPLTFGDLLRGGVAHYGPLLRLLLWSAFPLGIALGIGAAALGFNEKIHDHAILASEVETGRNIALVFGALLLVLAHASVEAGRGWIAADGRLRSALKAWWLGLRLLIRRPLAVLAAYLIPTFCSLLLAMGLLALRGHVDPATGTGWVLAVLLGLAIAAALAWGKVTRLHALRALAEDAHARR